jgi:N,N-dimethylformamidase
VRGYGARRRRAPDRAAPTPIEGEHDGVPQLIDAGSYAIVERPEAFAGLTRFTLQAFIQPTRVPIRPEPARQAIMGTWAEDRAGGFALLLDETGALALLIGSGPAAALVSTRAPLTGRRWYHVAASVDLAAGTVSLRQTPLSDHTPSLERPVAVTASVSATAAPPGEFFLAAARQGVEGGRLRTCWHFNGKIDRPRVSGRALTPAELETAAAERSGGAADADAIALWDLAADIPSDQVTDRSSNRLHGRTVNAPKRAVTGHNWDGTAMDWRVAPEQYGAIHFHDDDLHDAGWTPSLTLTIPAGTRSGAYALRLEAAGGPEFWVVFYVRPPRRGPRARTAFLASTATYLAYSNYRARMRQGPAELYIGALPIVDPTDLLLMYHPELGGSTYDTHSDGSGVCHVSRLRPIVNTRPTGRLWNFFLDLCLVDWLEAEGQPYDVITDDDLHAEGAALLEGYAVILTGCHPEYYSSAMLDALETHLGRGGRLMYMGGNGFYWRVSYPAAQPGLLEVRRAEDGTRAWVESVGEYYHSSTGEYGGMWRRQGRAPNALAGIGFVAQGFDRSSYYRRTAASRDPRARFIFEGIEDEDPRRLRHLRQRRRRARAGRVQREPGISRACSRGRLVRGPLERLPARQRGDERVLRGLGRAVLSRGARGHRLLRASGRRRRLLHRLHRLRREPGARRLQEQYRPAHGERPAPLPGSGALRDAIGDRSARGYV